MYVYLLINRICQSSGTRQFEGAWDPVPWRVFGPKAENEGSYIMKSFVICSLCQIIGRSYQERGRVDRTCNTNGRYEKCLQKFQSMNLDERDHFGDPGIHTRVI
jgi:hypothetical protein